MLSRAFLSCIFSARPASAPNIISCRLIGSTGFLEISIGTSALAKTVIFYQRELE